jgi:nitroreductase
MKIVVIGGSGFIGTKLVNNLRGLGHEVVAASPSLGVNTIAGEGLAEALSGAQFVVGVSNSPVYEAVTSRRAVRAFTGRPIPKEVLERVLSAAAWSPSGSNLQPWHAYVVTGAPLAELKKRAGERVAAGDSWDEQEYEMYPPVLKSPYLERRSAFGKERYGALGISREDLEARQRAAAANWDCFGAPAALFCYIDRDMGPPQWADVGMYLQTVMLLLRAEGLHSCTQMAWAKYHKTVAEILSPPDELLLFCGMSIGFEDVTVSHARTGRAPLDETVRFVEG